MTEELKPCPWCAGTDIQVVPHRMSPTMEKEGELISVEIRHHCPPTDGQPSRAVVRIGRDYESAIKAWNTRAESAEVERLREANKKLRVLLGKVIEDLELRASIGGGAVDLSDGIFQAAKDELAQLPDRE